MIIEENVWYRFDNDYDKAMFITVVKEFLKTRLSSNDNSIDYMRCDCLMLHRGLDGIYSLRCRTTYIEKYLPITKIYKHSKENITMNETKLNISDILDLITDKENKAICDATKQRDIEENAIYQNSDVSASLEPFKKLVKERVGFEDILSIIKSNYLCEKDQEKLNKIEIDYNEAIRDIRIKYREVKALIKASNDVEQMYKILRAYNIIITEIEL